MKNSIIRLIKDDIKVSRLINTLESLQVSAYKYSLGNAHVIFSLLGIKEDDENLSLYCMMIEQGENLNRYGTDEKVEELAEDIFRQLIMF